MIVVDEHGNRKNILPPGGPGGSGKTTAQIVMDFNKAKRQADELDRTAKAIRSESRRFSECRSEVTHAWQSESAINFTNKMGMVAEDLTKIAGELEKAATVIRDSARRIYEAEMEAKRLAEKRDLG